MEVVVIFNGLGNQMSQYALYLQKKHKNKRVYLISMCYDHNGLEIDRLFSIKLETGFKKFFFKTLFSVLTTNKLRTITRPLQNILKWVNCKITFEGYNYDFNPDILKVSNGINFYFGGWHTEKYFQDVKAEILSKYIFKKELDYRNIEIKNSLSNGNYVSLHVRRGDYLNESNLNLYGKVCTLDYFINAIAYIKTKIDAPKFLVFSNDIGWVKENLILENALFVEHNSGVDSWKDMYLMASCRHNIISNSSFSWWGAWLNRNGDKLVICPERFLNSDERTEVYPNDWVRIPS